MDIINPKLLNKNQIHNNIGEEVTIIDTRADFKKTSNNNSFIEQNSGLRNRMQELFNEFAKEGQNLNLPSISQINFSEKIIEQSDDFIKLIIFLIILFLCVILIIVFGIIGKKCYYIIPLPSLGLIVSIYLLCLFETIYPGEALILTYYGKYIGTFKTPGYFWLKPCSSTLKISLKSNQYNGDMIKVNDKDGTPVLIGLVSIWRITDTVKATYCVRNCKSFVEGQAESAIRFVANKFSYDSPEDNEFTLKSGSEDINFLLKLELQRRAKMAGIEIEDARITEISYGKEIESMMLQKQAADATISSREKIAKGAIKIIDDSIKEIKQRKIVRLVDEEKNRLVSNMMITLNMEKGSNVIINI